MDAGRHGVVISTRAAPDFRHAGDASDLRFIDTLAVVLVPRKHPRYSVFMLSCLGIDTSLEHHRKRVVTYDQACWEAVTSRRLHEQRCSFEARTKREAGAATGIAARGPRECGPTSGGPTSGEHTSGGPTSSSANGQGFALIDEVQVMVIPKNSHERSFHASCPT